MLLRYSLIALLALALAGGWCVFMRHSSVTLPPEDSYLRFPQPFRSAVLQARREAMKDRSEQGLEKLARLYQANRLLKEARIVYDAIGPRLSAEDRYDLALLALTQGELIEAANQLRLTLNLAPAYKPAQITLAEVLFKSGQSTEAEKRYEEILATDPAQPSASIGLARIELQKGRDGQAASRLEELLEKHPEQTEAVALLSQLWARRGNPERAAALAKWSRQRPAPVPDDPWRENLLLYCYDIQTLTLQFETYSNSGQLAKALPLLDRVETLDPENWIPDLLRGWSQAQAHHLDDAIASYNRALKKNGNKEKLIPLLASALTEKGEQREALKLCAQASNEQPDSMPILVAYEAALANGSDTETEARVLQRMLKAEPYTYSTNLKLSKIYWESGQRDEAVPYLEKIAALYPADVVSRALLGEYYVSKKQSTRAIEFLQQALEHVEKNAQGWGRLRSLLGAAYLQSSAVHSSAEKYEVAGEEAEKAAELVPDDAQALSMAAENFAQAKAYARAEAALQKMILLQPENPTVYLSLGDIEAQEGRADKAREHWRLALERVAISDSQLRSELQSRLDHGNVPARK